MSQSPVTRRQWLQATGIAAAGALAGASCAPHADAGSQPVPGGARVSARRFQPVHVSPERVIRTVVGLRPFRPSGFVLRAEKVEEKLLIHNYGHGGGGVSLSWGSARLAVEEALLIEERACAVLGCGVLGLSTARLLQRRGRSVTIYAKDLPPATTSNIAGAQWEPFSVYDHGSSTPAFLAQFERAARLSHRYFQDMVGDDYGVRWLENYELHDEQPGDPHPDPLADLYPSTQLLGPKEHPFPVPYVRRFTTMFIETPIYLNALVRDFLLAGGQIVVREFGELSEVMALPERLVVNCCGLGARALCKDEELTPIKGQLTVLLPQPEIDYITLSGGLYMFPRKDGILLGGTFARGEWSLAPDEEASERILQGHQAIFGGMRAT